MTNRSKIEHLKLNGKSVSQQQVQIEQDKMKSMLLEGELNLLKNDTEGYKLMIGTTLMPTFS